MNRYRNAIVRPPCDRMADGLTTADLGPPDIALARTQHAAYVTILKSCGLAVHELPPDNAYPDSTFIEDPAVLLPEAAIITRPGAPSRRGETESVEQALLPHFDTIHRIESPGTLDGGDIMVADTHYYIGISERTNVHGAAQLAAILKHHGLTSSTIELTEGLHLKSSVAYIEDRTIVTACALGSHPDFKEFRIIVVDDSESYAANCLWLNGSVLVAAGFPKTAAALQAAGYSALPIDVSEFRKLDGGLSCLSLRF